MKVFNKRNRSGVALLMVLSATTLLSFILAAFTLDTSINKLKVYNQNERLQAKMNAEAGVRFTLAKLKMYKEAVNVVAKNKTIANFVSPNDIQSVITEPLILPIPINERAMGEIQKRTIQEFTESILLEGRLSVFVKPVSAFLNPNGLIISNKQEEVQPRPEPENPDASEESDDSNDPPHVQIRKEFIRMLTEELSLERETNDNYDAIYEDADPVRLVAELMYFVNPPGSYEDPMNQTFDSLYAENNSLPKFGPLTSIDELYLLQGWGDAIVDLVKDRLNVHQSTVVPLNQITDKQLRLILPDITDIQIEEFFKKRDGDAELGIAPTPFRGLGDFEKLVIDELMIVDRNAYDTRIRELKQANIVLDTSGRLFKVTSTGELGRGRYTIEAIISLPVAPSVPKSTPASQRRSGQQESSPSPPPADPSRQAVAGESGNRTQEKEPTALLDPRVVEIRIL